jgi:hypothetical protein
VQHGFIRNYCKSALYKGTKINSLLIPAEREKSLKVHSLFRRVINIESSVGLISIVTLDLGRMGPYIVIPEFEGASFFDLDIARESSCKFEDGLLCIDDKLVIDLSSAVLWKGKLESGFKWEAEKFNRENLLILKAALHIYAAESSSFRRIFDYQEQHLTDAVKKLCSLSTIGETEYTVKNLIGLGPGLTPMGDDMLTGFLSVVSTCREGVVPSKVLSENIMKNLYRTNYLSGSMLQNAIDGIYHEYIQDLVYTVACEDADSIFKCTKRLLKIGATSGTDLATGIYLGFNSISQGKAR